MRVEISDHGCGIPPEDIPHIWERYYRTDAPAKGNHGSGLGLSIVKGIFDMHGAKYGVRSQIGAGSTFWFEMKIILPESKNRFKGFRNQWRKGQETAKKETAKKETTKKEAAKKDTDKKETAKKETAKKEAAKQEKASAENADQQSYGQKTAANDADTQRHGQPAADQQPSPGGIPHQTEDKPLDDTLQ